MKFQIDRDLPVALSLQLQGQIEYAIAYGDLAPDEKMPTVRELANELGISPVTVSATYKLLQEKKLLVAKQGLGTFVSPRARLRKSVPGLETNRQLDRLLRVARAENISTATLINMIHVRRNSENSPPVRLLFVGIFEEATAFYAGRLRQILQDNDIVTPVLLSDPAWPAHAPDHDLVITFAHIMMEVTEQVPETVPVESLRFIPSEETRTRLAMIEPDARVGVIATYPEFSMVLKRSVSRYAPHSRVTVSTMIDDPEAAEKLRNCDTVVYATGAITIVPELPTGINNFEFRHVPSPADLDATLAPLVADIRRRHYLNESSVEPERGTTSTCN